MGLETFSYISSLNSANPDATDQKSFGDNHIRGLKTALLNSFPNVNAPVSATPTELNYVVGVTSGIQSQLNVHTASINAVSNTPTGWTIKAFADTPVTAVVGSKYLINTTGGAVTLTLPASPTNNDFISIADYNGNFSTNNVTVGRNGKTIMGLSEDMTISTANASVTFVYVSASGDWKII